MNAIVTNKSSFRFFTIAKIVNFASWGLSTYLPKKIELEISDSPECSFEDCRKYKCHGKWGGATWEDAKMFIYISNDIKYPFLVESEYSPKNRYINGFVVKNKRELLISLISHELYHVMQYQTKKPIILSNIIPLDEDSGADIFSMIVLNRWRRLKSKKV